MAENDILAISGKINPDNIETILPQVAKNLNKYLTTPLPDIPTINDLYSSFCEGSREMSNSFYVQARMNPRGRIIISYKKKPDEQEGTLIFKATDNGEKVPDLQFEEFKNLVTKAFSENAVKFDKSEKYKEY